MATLAMFFRRPLATPAAAHNRPVPVDDRFRLRALPNEDVFLFVKRIDNSRIVREPVASTRSEWSLIGVACLIALLFMGALTPRVINIFSGYQLESLKKEQQHLLD